jgi:hypothetical protein
VALQVERLLCAAGEDGVAAADDGDLGRHPGVRATGLGRAAVAFTRASVWNVDTSGSSSSCFTSWPATPESQ